jgi:hypothetical protein
MLDNSSTLSIFLFTTVGGFMICGLAPLNENSLCSSFKRLLKIFESGSLSVFISMSFLLIVISRLPNKSLLDFCTYPSMLKVLAMVVDESRHGLFDLRRDSGSSSSFEGGVSATGVILRSVSAVLSLLDTLLGSWMS